MKPKIKAWLEDMQSRNPSLEKKVKVCEVCGDKIPPGTVYRRIIGEDKYVCLSCTAYSLGKLIDKKPIASLDYEK